MGQLTNILDFKMAANNEKTVNAINLILDKLDS